MDVVRFRGDLPEPLVQGIIVLLGLARESDQKFSFGPLELSALIRDGIVVKGEIHEARKRLAEIPGLAEVLD